MWAIRAARAFDGQRLIDAPVVVFTDQGSIVAVEAAPLALPHAWQVTDFPDSTVLPGLIDCHVHLCGDTRAGGLDRISGHDAAPLAQLIGSGLRSQLAAGVTTVRDVGDLGYLVLDWRQSARQAPTPSPCPTVLASGPPVTSRGGHRWYLGGQAEGLDELRQAVRQRADRRVDLVTIMADGDPTTDDTSNPVTDAIRCQYHYHEIAALVELAHAHGLPVTAHAHGLAAVHQAIAARVDGIEHATCLTPSGSAPPDWLLDSLAASQIPVCPTLGRTHHPHPAPTPPATSGHPRLTQPGHQLIGRMHRAGVVLVAGTNAGTAPDKPHGILPHAISELITAGIPPADALASATSTAARACGRGHRKGRLHAGYDADLLLVDGNPLIDPTALNRVTAVILHGTMIHRAH